MQNRNEVLDALRLGVCSLVYEKLNGDIRQANGTLKEGLIPKEFLPKSKEMEVTPLEQKDPNQLIHYFDLGANGWRCFWPENLKSLKLG
jgi:hypothetical protein